MPDVLRVTTPVNSNSPVGKITNPQQPQSAQQVDPSKVGQNANVAANENEGSKNATFDSTSVFQTFANRIFETPDLTQTLQKLLLGALTNGEQTTGTDGTTSVPEMLSQLAEKLNMDESEILQNLLFQKDQSTSFGSNIFDVLREITQNDSTTETTAYIGNFLKALDGYATSKQTMQGIMTQLNNILDRIPRSFATDIKEAMGELNMDADDKGIQENLQLLRDEILPMLGKYVSSTNDLSATRDRIQLLVQDLSRLNLSGKEELTQRFTELMDYARFNLNLPGDKLAQLQKLYEDAVADKGVTKNDFIDSLAKALTHTDGLSTTSQTMVNDTIDALLLDRSVYMPFNHIFLPFLYQGNFMFTEMWVEKDGHKGNSESEASDEQTKRVYLNFDIQGLGKFQAAIGLRDNTIDCLLNFPESVADKTDEIETEVAQIFTRNGFSINSVKSSNDSFKTELEVLHKIYEGRSSINVTV